MNSDQQLAKLASALNGLASGAALLQYMRQELSAVAGIDVLCDKICAVVSEARGGGSTAGDEDPAKALEGAMGVVKQVQLQSPRAKYDVGIFSDQLVFVAAKSVFAVKAADVNHVAIIDDMPGDGQKNVFVFLSIARNAGVQRAKKAVACVVLVLPRTAEVELPNPKAAGQQLPKNVAAVAWCQLLGSIGVKCAYESPEPSVFSSASKSAAITAYDRANEGYLIPLTSAICYSGKKQSCTMLHADIKGVELMRASGFSQTFDAVFHLKNDGGTLELSSISRGELAPLQHYISSRRLPLGDGTDAEGPSSSQHAARAMHDTLLTANFGEDDDEETEEDSDFEPSEPASKRQRRDAGGASSSAAVHAEDDEDDDDDDEDEEDDDEDESDVEVVSEDDMSTAHLNAIVNRQDSKD